MTNFDLVDDAMLLIPATTLPHQSPPILGGKNSIMRYGALNITSHYIGNITLYSSLGDRLALWSNSGNLT